ncbi:HNH endonuclease [Streptacidiphilus albus]|uniref:HNH endonuclease n=1 Tax=Streptacidiphilus albus TaxID=105425 RepID=UPI001364D61D|nr:HNH endonuclease signature motif containing protein [Streptacidiphilus albus]
MNINSGTRCAACIKEYKRTRPKRVYKSKNADRRGYDTQWRKTVKAAIALQPYCLWCFTTGSPVNPLTGDHIVPLSKGGTNAPTNVRVLCRTCNSTRGNQ